MEKKTEEVTIHFAWVSKKKINNKLSLLIKKNPEKKDTNQHVGEDALQILQFSPVVKVYISQTLYES